MTLGALVLLRPALQVVLYNWLNARMVGCPPLDDPPYVPVRLKLFKPSATDVSLMLPAVLEMIVTVALVPSARKPVWPAQRFTASRRFWAWALTLAPIRKFKPVLSVVLAVRVTRREPVRPIVTVCPAAGPPVNAPLHCSCAVPVWLAPAAFVVYAT